MNLYLKISNISFDCKNKYFMCFNFCSKASASLPIAVACIWTVDGLFMSTKLISSRLLNFGNLVV